VAVEVRHAHAAEAKGGHRESLGSEGAHQPGASNLGIKYEARGMANANPGPVQG
jgi:hypothetical protein